MVGRHIDRSADYASLIRPTGWEHLIREKADYARHIDYCMINPVKHKLVSRVQDWPYSSFHRDVRRGVYPQDWAGDPDVEGKFGEAS